MNECEHIWEHDEQLLMWYCGCGEEISESVHTEIASLKAELNSILEQSNIFTEKAKAGHKEIIQGIKSLKNEVKTLLADKQRLTKNNIWVVEEFNRIRDEKSKSDAETNLLKEQAQNNQRAFNALSDKLMERTKESDGLFDETKRLEGMLEEEERRQIRSYKIQCERTFFYKCCPKPTKKGDSFIVAKKDIKHQEHCRFHNWRNEQ